jgi:hypothetical protein
VFGSLKQEKWRRRERSSRSLRRLTDEWLGTHMLVGEALVGLTQYSPVLLVKILVEIHVVELLPLLAFFLLLDRPGALAYNLARVGVPHNEGMQVRSAVALGSKCRVPLLDALRDGPLLEQDVCRWVVFEGK